jgi:hypothetical protein
MLATLNVTTKIIAFNDAQISSNPRLRLTDWMRDMSGIAVADPKSESHQILPGASYSIFNNARTTTIDGTSVFSLALLASGTTRYRITNTAGTVPGFRTPRTVAISGLTLTVTAQSNGTLVVASSAAAFGAVQLGDYVFIPGVATGDAANVFSVLNVGYWVVLGVSGTQNITLVRPVGQDFVGVSEVVVPASNSQFKVFSAAGIQIGDSLDITAGFASSSLKNVVVTAVTDSFVEFTSTVPMYEQTGVLPGNAGLAFYSETREFLYVESDSEVVVRINGDTGNYQRTVPVDSSDPTRPGVYMKWGPVWSLTLYNRSSVTANVTVIHAGAV